MKKKLLSLALALALCLGLSVPALATEVLSTHIIIGHGFSDEGVYLTTESQSGEGWSYDVNLGGTPTLTLNGVNTKEGEFIRLSISDSLIINLAPGSKNTLGEIALGRTKGTTSTITFQGSGELILDATIHTGEYPAFSGIFDVLKLEDGLTATGGLTKGASSPLTLPEMKEMYQNRSLMIGNQQAPYVRIAPAASAAPETPAATGFTDVAAGSPYAEAVQWAVDQKITAGKTATTFGPGDTCTVSHILTFLWRANGRPGDKGDERAAVAAWAQGLGIGTGNLTAPCTRSMAVLYMWKAAGSPAPAKTASFADVPADADYASAVSWAVEKGITNGTGGDAFSPGGTCTRGQIVTFLYRAGK